MQRTDNLDINGSRLFQQCLYVRSVFSYDIGIVTAGIIQPVAVKINLIVKQLAIQCAKASKGISGKQNAVCYIKADHCFRPVHHRSLYKGDGVLTEASGIAFLDLFCAPVNVKAELMHQQEAFFG